MKIAVLLSGGVDSSVALRLLKDEGHDVTAFYLKIWLQDEFSFLGDCPWEEDLEYARGVCKNAGVPLEVIPLQTEYWEKVVSYTIREVKAGRTPNPDMYCNRLIKFGEFYDKIDGSFEKVASGHYAWLREENGRKLLTLSPDPVKDQTYFLAYMKKDQFERALFPIGRFTKKEIRRLAENYNLPNMARKDSQGICFLGQIQFKEFLKFHLGIMKGDIVEINSGKKLGVHDGYYFYTIGQRSGLGLSGGPWYVVKKDVEQNIVYISQLKDIPGMERVSFTVKEINWISPAPENRHNIRVKIRHGAKFFNASLLLTGENEGQVTIDTPEKGIAPGQFAVFYENDICFAGGIIAD